MAQKEFNEGRDTLVMRMATVGLFLFLAGSLAYAYPQFLPAPPEQTVNRFLKAHQGDTWGYVEASLLGPKELKYEYIRTASECQLLGFRPRGDNFQRLQWALDSSTTEARLKVLHYYQPRDGQQPVTVWVDYTLQKHGDQWFILLESIIPDGDLEKYLDERGVSPEEVQTVMRR